MIIDLTKLFFTNLYEISFSDTFDVPKEYLEKSDIIRIFDAKAEGDISYDGEILTLNCKVTGTMVLKCCRTLKEVEYPFDIDIEEEINENNYENVKIIQNRVDIFPILWQYILVDIPLRVLAPNAENELVKGEGWCLVDEDTKKEEIDPRLECLNKFRE